MPTSAPEIALPVAASETTTSRVAFLVTGGHKRRCSMRNVAQHYRMPQRPAPRPTEGESPSVSGVVVRRPGHGFACDRAIDGRPTSRYAEIVVYRCEVHAG